MVAEMIQNGAKVFDVRSPGEFSGQHYEGAINIPVDEVAQRLSEFGDDKSTAIIVYCGSGMRSGKAKQVLENSGFSNVVNGGGISDMLRL